MKLELRADKVVWRALDDEVVGLDLEASRYFRLNASGAFLWQQVSEAKTQDQLIDALVETYGIGRDQATRDVHDFVSMLSDRQFLQD